MEKDKVITDLLKRIANLEYEVEKQEDIINKINNYVDKMGYGEVINNPREDLVKILKKEKHNE